MCEYMELYRSSEEDEKNPYFAPLQHHDFSNLPDTLLITMEYDPLRDEGEALGEKMREAGCSVKSVRVLDGIHGMMLLPPIFAGAKEIYEAIEGFIGKRGQSEDEAVKIDASTENEVSSDKK